MLEPCSRPGSTDAGDLDNHMTEFIATLAERGYAEKTQRDKRRLIVPFIQWVREGLLRSRSGGTPRPACGYHAWRRIDGP